MPIHPQNPYAICSEDNPAPFRQPFLELVLAGGEATKISPRSSVFHIDVGGKIEKYITKEHRPTELLIGLCKAFAKAGVVVTEFNRYKGSAGPAAVLLNGALFYRVDVFERPPGEVFAYEYREPKYRGPLK